MGTSPTTCTAPTERTLDEQARITWAWARLSKLMTVARLNRDIALWDQLSDRRHSLLPAAWRATR